jgi:hypothetical protein
MTIKSSSRVSDGNTQLKTQFKHIITGFLLSASWRIVSDLTSTPPSFDILKAIYLGIPGAIAGYFTNFVIRLLNSVNETIEKLNSMKTILMFEEFQSEAINMIDESQKHKKSLEILLSSSVEQSLRQITNVDRNRYLTILTKVAENCEDFKAIQRYPISWFMDNEIGKIYLQNLKKKIKRAKRIFIISDNHKEKMESDLKNDSVMSFYWENTGAGTETFWIAEKNLKEDLGILEIPTDQAIFDDELIIKYDHSSKILSFGIIKPSHDSTGLFNRINEQLKISKDTPFLSVKRQA